MTTITIYVEVPVEIEIEGIAHPIRSPDDVTYRVVAGLSAEEIAAEIKADKWVARRIADAAAEKYPEEWA